MTIQIISKISDPAADYSSFMGYITNDTAKYCTFKVFKSLKH